MNNLDIVKAFPYKIQPNSSDKVLIEEGGNISSNNSDLHLPDLSVQYLDIYLINNTSVVVSVYYNEIFFTGLPIKSFMLLTPSNLGAAKYIISSQGSIVSSDLDEKMFFAQVSSSGSDEQGTGRTLSWDNMVLYDFDSGIFKKSTSTPNSALGFGPTSLFVDSYCEFTLSITRGYGSAYLLIYNSTPHIKDTFRVFKPADTPETIPEQPNVVLSSSKIIPINQGDYFYIGSTSSTMLFTLIIKKVNNIQ